MVYTITCVRAVNDLLKIEFDLEAGLADQSKIEIEFETDITDLNFKNNKRRAKKKVHRVQILDPATGTGTFLAAVVRKIYERYEGLEGLWPSYVDQHLIPRLNGFELLMAPYAMAHLKLDLILQETGYIDPSQYHKQKEGIFSKHLSSSEEALANQASHQQRFNIYLTNSLEPGIKEVPNLFMNQWLTTESQEASRIKTQTPVMVVLGNPPYSGESANKGKWIMDLMDAYKKEPGGKQKLQERNSKWINADENKFVRMAQHLIQKTGEGIVAYIMPHNYLDAPTFRGMRWHLLKTYDKIYTIDLHGNSTKKETTPDGGKDDNVFDILQGVSINFFVKTGNSKKKALGQVFHFDLYGRRKNKYEFLNNNNLEDINFTKIPNVAPDYFMVPKDFGLMKEYSKCLELKKLFQVSSNGMTTAHDEFVYSEKEEDLISRFQDFRNEERDEEILHRKFLVKKKKGWNILKGYDELVSIDSFKDQIQPVSYRPFDNNYIIYNDNLVWRTVKKTLENFISTENIGLIIGRAGQVVGGMQWNLAFISDKMLDFNFFYRGGGLIQPLYLTLEKNKNRTPNLNRKLISNFAKCLDLTFLPDHDCNRLQEGLKDREKGKVVYDGWELPSIVENLEFKISNSEYFTPLDVLDYIYAVLHSPTYRERYKEFLKTDFPRVPWPESQKKFWKLVSLGREIREYHLMEHPKSNESLVTYPAAGDNRITRKITKTSIGWETTSKESVNSKIIGRVWINEQQYFDNIPKIAWEFYIGGYQPAQKWLKDRRERELSMDDIQHYCKIITALIATEKLMKEIDKIEIMENC